MFLTLLQYQQPLFCRFTLLRVVVTLLRSVGLRKKHAASKAEPALQAPVVKCSSPLNPARRFGGDYDSLLAAVLARTILRPERLAS
jgi:hypothetical protein